MRVMLLVAAMIVVAVPACGGNQRDEVIEPGGPPPLPPASGSVIGYLIDAKRDLTLRDDQLAKLERLDQSLAARNGQIDAQLRMIEKPAPAEQLSPQQMKAGESAPRYNNAPGASTLGTSDSAKLHKMRDDNDHEAIEEALAVLDADQRTRAQRILQDRGVTVPGATQKSQPATDSDSGTPLPGMEP